MTSGAAYRVRCADECQLDRLLVGRAAAEYACRRHYERTGHRGVLEPLDVGDRIRIGD